MAAYFCQPCGRWIAPTTTMEQHEMTKSHLASAPVKVHVCDLSRVWPVGHPLPPEDPARLTGPEVGYAVYAAKYPEPHDEVVSVVERSYVWSPSECRHNGGYRRYDWSVIERGPGRGRIVVNDSDLSPIPDDMRVEVVYSLRRRS